MIIRPNSSSANGAPISGSKLYAYRGCPADQRHLFALIEDHHDGTRLVEWSDGSRGRLSLGLWHHLRVMEAGHYLEEGRLAAREVLSTPPGARSLARRTMEARAEENYPQREELAWWRLGFGTAGAS